MEGNGREGMLPLQLQGVSLTCSYTYGEGPHLGLAGGSARALDPVQDCSEDTACIAPGSEVGCEIIRCEVQSEEDPPFS